MVQLLEIKYYLNNSYFIINKFLSTYFSMLELRTKTKGEKWK